MGILPPPTPVYMSMPQQPARSHMQKIHRLLQTGSSAFLLPPRPIRSIAIPMYGPTTGTFLAKAAIVPRKSPNKTMIPYNSTRKPINGHRSRIRASPPKKAAVPFTFCLRAKKRRVLAGPMITVSPMRKRICGRRLGCQYGRRDAWC